MPPSPMRRIFGPTRDSAKGAANRIGLLGRGGGPLVACRREALVGRDARAEDTIGERKVHVPVREEALVVGNFIPLEPGRLVGLPAREDDDPVLTLVVHFVDQAAFSRRRAGGLLARGGDYFLVCHG